MPSHEELEYEAREAERAEYEAAEAAFYQAEAEAEAANEQYQLYLAERGISEDEHLAEIMEWCDRQD